MAVTILLDLVFGAVAGLASGLFGIGGGAIIVPFLVWSLPRQGVDEEVVMIMAVATSLATIVVTSLSSVRAHQRRGFLDWSRVARLTPGLVCGTVLGSIIADHLPTPRFKQLFALFLLVVAVRLFRSEREEQVGNWKDSKVLMVGGGFGIGVLSALFGIGGGSLTVPFLLKCGSSVREAVAVSAACGFPIAVVGTVSYVLLGWHGVDPLPPGSLGYVHGPAFLGIASASVVTAPVGAALAHRLPMRVLKKLFALVLFGLGIRMLWQ